MSGELVEHPLRRRRDVGYAQALYLTHRTRPEHGGDHGQAWCDPAHPLYDTPYLLLIRHGLLAHGQHEQVGDHQPVGSEIPDYVLGVLVRPCNQHAPPHLHRRDRGPRAVEDRHPRIETVGDPRPFEHVGDEGLPRQPPAAPATPHGRYPAQGRRLVVVARRVRPPREGFEQISAPYLHLVARDHLGARRSSAAHGDDPGIESFPREEPGEIARYRSLPEPLSRPNDRERRLGGYVVELRRSQLEVAANVARPGRES